MPYELADARRYLTMPRNSPAIIELTSRNPYERKTRKEPVGMNAAMTRHRMIRMPTDRRGDRALMLAAADYCAVSLRYPLLAFRPFDGKSRGLDTLCSVPKASLLSFNDSFSTCRSYLHNRVCPIVPGGCWWKWAAFNLIHLDRFFDNLAELSKNRFFIVPVATTEKQAGTTSDEALILVGPFNYLHISTSSIHNLASSIALVAARS